MGILWHKLFYPLPESLGMVGMSQMRQFMNNEVIDRLFWGHDNSPVQIKVAFTGAAPPPRLLIFQPKVMMCHLHSFLLFINLVDKHSARLNFIPSHDSILNLGHTFNVK